MHQFKNKHSYNKYNINQETQRNLTMTRLRLFPGTDNSEKDSVEQFSEVELSKTRDSALKVLRSSTSEIQKGKETSHSIIEEFHATKSEKESSNVDDDNSGDKSLNNMPSKTSDSVSKDTQSPNSKKEGRFAVQKKHVCIKDAQNEDQLCWS